MIKRRFKRLRKGMLYGLLCTILLMAFAAVAQQFQEKQPWHHHEDGFRNLPDNPEKNSFGWGHFKFFTSRPFAQYDEPYPDTHIVPAKEAQRRFEALKGSDSVTWIGHMTLLIKLNGVVVLTDPWLSDCATPIPPFGPCRAVPPGLNKLPQVDVVVITHNHYDHLDLPSLKQLPNLHLIIAVVPLKVAEILSDIPFKEVIALDWHQSYEIKDNVTLTAVPSVHWSKRTLFNENKTLWAGWVIASEKHKLYYSEGEYGNVYKEIGKRYGPMDYAFISAGAYEPRAVMKGSHCIPENCVQIGMDVKAKKMIPVHWGTIALGTEGLLTAGPAFMKAAQAKQVGDRAQIMRIGETLPLTFKP